MAGTTTSDASEFIANVMTSIAGCVTFAVVINQTRRRHVRPRFHRA